MAKKYETAEVPISRAKHVSRLFLASFYCLGGITIIIADIRGVFAHDTWVWGAIVLSLGLCAIFAWRRPVERQLTEKGLADKAADDYKAAQRNKNINSAIWSLICLCFFVFAIIYFPQLILDMISGKIRTYALICDVKHDGPCPQSGWKAGFVTSYTVRPDQQLVIGRLLEEDAPPIKLTNCTVEDRTNWTCDGWGLDGAAIVRMHDGDFHAESIWSESIRYVSRLKWWMTRLTNGRANLGSAAVRQ